MLKITVSNITNVLPSLAKQCEVTVNGICRKKYACLFPDCVSKKTLLDDETEMINRKICVI
jgi:hypothetical protein